MHCKNTSRRDFLKKSLGSIASFVGLSFLSPAKLWAVPKGGLVLANYDNYMSTAVLGRFEKKKKISIFMDLFSDNGDLFTKLRVGEHRYDLIMATSDWVQRYIQSDFLLPLDWKKLPTVRANSFSRFLDAPFDKERQYSVTYTWGTIGIGYRKSKVEEKPDSWKWLYDSDRYKGRIALQASCDDLIGPAIVYLGGSIDSKDPTLYKKAFDLILKQRDNIRLFSSGNGQDILASGDVDLIVEQNGDIHQVMEEDKDLDFILPKEGGILWQDNLCIPKHAPNPDAAHAFIDFIYEAQNGFDIFQTIQFGTPNKAAYNLISSPLQKDKVIFPSEEELDRCQVANFVNEDIWKLRHMLCLKCRL